MKYALVFLAAWSCAFAQDTVKTNVLYQTSGAGVVTAGAVRAFGAAVQGAPYSATITNESVQTLPDGNRIIQNNSGTTARDSEGRTRQDAALPMIGNLSAANAPHIVFIMDPVAQISYTLNLTDKTAQKLAPSGAVVGGGGTVGTGPADQHESILRTERGRLRGGRPLACAATTDVHPEDDDCRGRLSGNHGRSGNPDDGRAAGNWSAHHSHHSRGRNRQRKTDRDCDRGVDFAGPEDRRLQQAERSADGRANIQADQHHAC